METEETGTIEIRQYLALIQRWLWLIALASLLAGATAYVASRLATPIYEVSATLLISEGQKPTGIDYNSVLMSERLAKTYAQMLQGERVLEETEGRLGISLEDATLTVEPVRDTQLIRLKVRHPDPTLAVQIANTLPQVFIELNQEAQSARYAGSIENLEREMQDLQEQIETTTHDLEAERAKGLDDGKAGQLETLLAQYRSTYAGLLQSYEEIRTAQARQTDTVTIFESAKTPLAPALPRTRTNVMLAIAVGAMLAVGTAFLIEYLDDTVKKPEDIEQATRLPTLAHIGRFPHSTNGEGPLISAHPHSSVAEGYRVLRTNLEFGTLPVGGGPVVILVTSTQPQEGKTTTLVNLGISLAQIGKRVVLVDTDLRKPTLHKHFHLATEAGLTSLLLTRNPNPDTILCDSGVPNLRIMAAGPIPASPAEILAMPETTAVLERLKGCSDYVLLDSPPVLSAADASILAQHADGVLLVTEVGRTRTAMLQRAVTALEKVKARLLGVALNKVNARPGSYYYDYYYYYYYASDGESTRKRRGRSLARHGRRKRDEAQEKDTRATGRGKL